MTSPKQPRAIKTRSRIIHEAGHLFSLKGYHDTKVGEIVKAAEITTGAFFHHFETKEALGLAVIDSHMRWRRRTLDKIEEGLPGAPGNDPLQRVFRRLDAISEMVACWLKTKGGGCIIGNLCTALSNTHPVFRKRLSECLDEMAAEFEPNLGAALELSRPEQEVDTRYLSRYIVTVIEGAIMLSRTHGDPDLIARHFNALKDYLTLSVKGQQALQCQEI